MYVTFEDFRTGWFGISIGVQPNEVDRLIEQLKQLKENPEQHFHISSDFEGEGGVGDIEIFIEDNKKSNMTISGFAISPNR